MNVDGKGFKDPAKEHLDWMKSKRTELYKLGLSTLFAVVVIAILVALIRGHLNLKVARSIAVWNLSGLVGGAILSLAAR